MTCIVGSQTATYSSDVDNQQGDSRRQALGPWLARRGKDIRVVFFHAYLAAGGFRPTSCAICAAMRATSASPKSSVGILLTPILAMTYS